MLLSDRETEWTLLMRAARDGDREAYGRLLGSLVRPLRQIVARGLARAGLGVEDAEDVVQEVLLAVHLKGDSWDTGQPITPWIAGIARHKLIDFLRRRRRHVQVTTEDLLGPAIQPAEIDVTQSQVHSLLAKLPDAQREAVVAISVDGLPMAAAAHRLGRSEGALRTSLHRALQSLADMARSG